MLLFTEVCKPVRRDGDTFRTAGIQFSRTFGERTFEKWQKERGYGGSLFCEGLSTNPRALYCPDRSWKLCRPASAVGVRAGSRVGALAAPPAASRKDSYLVDPASSHMLVSKIKPCMSKYKQLVL
jgi:hypothetical protein